MFDRSYKFRYVNNLMEGEGVVRKRTHTFTFRCSRGHAYIVRVEQYQHSFYVIKYYLKAHKNSPHKYSLKTGFNSGTQATRILQTCINIMLYMYKEDQFASFGCIAAASNGETIDINARFRIYRRMFANDFSATTFQHHEVESQSLYLIINRSQPEENLNGLRTVFEAIWTEFIGENSDYSALW